MKIYKKHVFGFYNLIIFKDHLTFSFVLKCYEKDKEWCEEVYKPDCTRNMDKGS